MRAPVRFRECFRMVLEDLSLNEATCSECRKPISTIPSWLAGAHVKFQCEECRQKHPRIPGMADIDPRRSLAAHDEPADPEDVVEEVDEDEEEMADEADEYA